jgi:hypothetical protein
VFKDQVEVAKVVVERIAVDALEEDVAVIELVLEILAETVDDGDVMMGGEVGLNAPRPIKLASRNITDKTNSKVTKAQKDLPSRVSE